METKTITITREEYNRLLEAEALLSALEAAGVDNWGGYGDALEMAILNKRKWVGSEISEEYCKIAEKRMFLWFTW